MEHLGLEPSSISLQGRYADPARAPIGFAQWGQTLQLRVHGAMARRKGLTPRMGDMEPGVGFEPTSPRLQRGAFTRLASQANGDWCGRQESNPCLCGGAARLCH